jgi:hypothetical protein
MRALAPEGCVGVGYAAGCAAVAVPRREVPLMLLGYALDAAFSPKNERATPGPGA